jgi:hypothetical protein
VLPEAGDGAGRAVAAVSGGDLQRQRGGSSGGWQSDAECSGKASREGLRRRASSRATRVGQGRQGETSGGAARRPTVALSRGRGGGRRRGAPGADLQFPNILGTSL